MEIADLLPFLFPVAIVQLLVQAYYIRHCWMNGALSQKQKAIYITSIAVFHLAAAAFYLFWTSRRKEQKIDNQVRQGIFVVLIIAFEIMTLRIIFQNAGPQYNLMIGLLGVCLTLMFINELLVRNKPFWLSCVLAALQVLLVLPVEYLSESSDTQFILLTVVAVIINRLPMRAAKIYSLAAFVLYIAVHTAKAIRLYGSGNSDEFIGYIYLNVAIYFLVFITFYTLKKQLLGNVQLEKTLATLGEQSIQLEEMSVMAERSRLAGEIHDNVGHNLTSAVIAVEAAEKLLETDPIQAAARLALAKEQIRHGLNEIRHSVRAIQSGEPVAFLPALEALIDEIRRSTGLRISLVAELESDLLPIQQSVFLRAVKECATNSLRHGESLEADLLLQEFRGSIRFTFSDNGKGSEIIRYGFGLKNMDARVRSLGGLMSVDSAPGEGFTVSMTIPTGLTGAGDQHA